MNKFFVALIAMFALAVPASADECVPNTKYDGVELEVAGFYVDNDPCQPDCLFSVWIYQESNDIEGLQRGDEVVDHTCGGAIESDTIIF